MESSVTPFFIVGCRRSGTTLVERILNSHSRLAVYYETYFFPLFSRELRFFGDLRSQANLEYFIDNFRAIIRIQGVEPPSTEAIRRLLHQPVASEVFGAFLHLFATGQDKSRGGEKTPEHHRFLAEMTQWFPDSPIVFVVRDPRDTIVSIRRVFGAKTREGIHSWNEAVRNLMAHRERVFLVRLEDLVSDPRGGVRHLCSGVGEDFEEGMLRFFQSVPACFTKQKGKELLGKPITDAVVGQFRSLPDDEIARIEEACSFGMKFLGYSPVCVTPTAQLRTLAPPEPRVSTARSIMERLRYYGLNAERWQRGAARWRLSIRVRSRYYFRRLGSRRSAEKRAPAVPKAGPRA